MSALTWDQVDYAPTLGEALRGEYDAQRTHADVICPPDPAARCAHCGISLGDHTTIGPNQVPNPANAVCMNASLLWNRFKLATGESLDCPEATVCTLCGAEVCTEHSTTEIVTCSDSAVLHHAECVDACDDCVLAYAETTAADRAIEKWKGCW